MINCRECGTELVVGENWSPSGPEKRNYICKKCASIYDRQWREEHSGYTQPLIICKGCNEEKAHRAKGLCSQCYMRQYNAEHRKKNAKYHRQYCQENPRRLREYARRRRARKKNATIGPVDEQKIYNLYDHACIYCGATREKLELDHVVPLARDGSHCEDNLVAACSSCNSSKHDKPLIEWLRTQPRARAWVT